MLHAIISLIQLTTRKNLEYKRTEIIRKLCEDWVKERRFFMKRILSFIIATVLVLSLCSCSTTSSKYPTQIELVKYIGLELSAVEADLSTELKDMTQYFDSTYRFEVDTTLVDFAINADGKIVRIHLRDSGELGYTLCGVTTAMDEATASGKLTESGATFVRGGTWQCSNKTDAIIQEDSDWIYDANSAFLEEQLLLAKMENSLTFQYEDSEGIYYIGNHQFVEYCYSTLPRFAHDYNQLTEYQRSVWNETVAGRYLMVSGTVTGVTERGTVIVMCEDKALGEEVGNILPTVSFAELTLAPEQEALLMSLKEKAEIVAFGRIDPDIFDGLYFHLSDTFVFEVDSSVVEIPAIERAIPGITRFDENGNILPGANAGVELDELELSFFFADTIFEQLSENAMQMTQFLENRYIKLIGKISYFSTDGTMFSVSSISGYYASDTINCHINKEQQKELSGKKIGDFVTLYCKISDVESLLGYTITAEVISFENESNRYVMNRQPFDYDTFWNQTGINMHYDQVTQEYMDPATFGFISISAGKDTNGEVTYWLTKQAGSESKEIGGDIIEVARYIEIPSKEIWTEGNQIVIEFAVDGYCEYTGSVRVIKEYRENDFIVDYIYANAPGLLDTSNTEWNLGAS